MRTESEIVHVTQLNEAWKQAQLRRQHVPTFIGVFDMMAFRKVTKVPKRKTIRLYLRQASLGGKVDRIRQQVASGGTFSIGILEDNTKISYFTVTAVRDLSSEEGEKALFLLRVTCHTREEAEHIHHLYRVRHGKANVIED